MVSVIPCRLLYINVIWCLGKYYLETMRKILFLFLRMTSILFHKLDVFDVDSHAISMRQSRTKHSSVPFGLTAAGSRLSIWA